MGGVVAFDIDSSDFAGGDVQRGDQRRCPVADVFELASLRPAGLHALRRVFAGLGLIPVFSSIDNTTAFAGGAR